MVRPLDGGVLLFDENNPAVNRIPVHGGQASFARCQARTIGETSSSVIAGKVEITDEEIGRRRPCERLRPHRRAVIRRAENINVNLSLSEVLSLLDHADDDEVLAGTSEENRKRALWQFYSTGMLTHSHSDGEFPIYSQGESSSSSSSTLSFFRSLPVFCTFHFYFHQLLGSYSPFPVFLYDLSYNKSPNFHIIYYTINPRIFI